jgi:hypothetical protein
MGERVDHIALSVLYDFVAGNIAVDTEAREHIDSCEQCRTDITWLQWLADFGNQERKFEPPVWAMTNAENAFKLKKPGIVTIAKEVVASLVYDSFSEPLPFGVRRRDLPARQALYQTDNVQLDLKIELGDEKGLLIGQIVADRGDIDVTGLSVEITQSGEVIGKSTTNRLGEFIFQNLPKGNYELQVVLSDTMVKLPPLPLND